MFYCLRTEYKKLLWFIFGIFCGLLIGRYNFKNLLLEDAYAINSSTWYNTNNMSLYSALIGQGSDIKDNGANGIEGGVPYIQFSRITATNYDLILATENFILDQTYQFNIYSCGLSTLDSNVRTGPSRTDTASASNVLHYTSGVGTPVSGFSISPCRIDMYNFKVNKRGNLIRIGISNNNTGSSRLLGFSMGVIPGSGTGSGISQTDLINSQNTIISNINSNNNNTINGALSDLESNLSSNNNSNFNQVNSNLTDLNSNVSSDYFTPNTGNDFFDSESLSGQEDLLSLVELPLEFLENLANSTCSPMSFNFRYGNHTQNITFPCMSSTYRTYAPDIFTLYQTITTGLICYYCIMSMIHTTTKVLDPEKAHLETVDL